MLFLVLAFLVAFSAYSVYGAIGHKESRDRILFFSRRSLSSDSNIVSLAKEFRQISYYRQDTKFGKAVARAKFRGTVAPPLYMLKTTSGGSDVSSSAYEVVSSAPQMDEEIAEIGARDVSAGNLNFIIAGLLGVLLALFARKRTATQNGYAIISGLASIIALYQFLHQCPTCPHVAVFGVPSGLAGMIVYGALCLTCLMGLSYFEILVPLICGLTATWQLAQLLGGSESCQPCELIFLLNFMVVGSALLSLGKVVATMVTPRPTSLLKLIVPSVSLGVSWFLVFAFASPSKSEVPKTSILSQNAWVGKNISKQFPNLGLKNYRGLVMFWKEGCHPCELAKVAVEQQVQIPVKEVLLTDNQLFSTGVSEIQNSEVLFPATPTFLVVRNGAVKNEFLGWSSDPAYWKSIVAETFSAIKTVKPTIMEIKKDETKNKKHG